MQKGQGVIFLVIGIVISAVVVGGAYYLGRQTTSKPVPAFITTSQNTQPTSVPSAGSGEITSWKTYTNTVYNYQFKYPEGYKITDKVPNQSICILKNGDNTCKLIIAVSPLNEYQLVDNAGGFIFYFDIKQKEWLHYKTNTASQFIPKRTQSLTESYTYKTGDVKCSQEYILIPTSSYSNIAEIVNNKCKDDDGNFLPGYNDFSTDQVLSTFKFTP